MNDTYIAQPELRDIAKASRKLDDHLTYFEGGIDLTGHIHVTDSNGDRLGTFYNYESQWQFFPGNNRPETREVSTDEKEALERFREAAAEGRYLTAEEIEEILP